MSMECCAYSFLEETSYMCDYEIATDHLASSISLARHHIKHIKQQDLRMLIELVYHANGSIRGACAIKEEEFYRLHQIYEAYHIELHHFVLPDGCIGASWLHVLRADTKAAVRLMYRIKQEGHPVDKRLLDFMNLLSNTFFMMALYENREEQHAETMFISRSYES